MSPTRKRLLAAATELFAARGYDGTSVRAICAAAEANLNAVSYHFNGKQGLYASVIEGVGDRRLASAKRILDAPARNRSDLETRLLLFAEETLVSWLEEPGILAILFAELQQGWRNCTPEVANRLAEHNQVLVQFLQAAKRSGVLRSTIDVDIMAGALLERLNSQVLYADAVLSMYGASIKAPEYRQHWVRQTVDLLLFGAISHDASNPR